MRRADLFDKDQFEGTTPKGEIDYWAQLAADAATPEERPTIEYKPGPGVVDQTRSPAAVFQKREFFKYLPENIGYFAPKRPNSDSGDA